MIQFHIPLLIFLAVILTSIRDLNLGRIVAMPLKGVGGDSGTPKTEGDLACALRSCDFFEQDSDTALLNCANGKEMVPMQLIYAVTQSFSRQTRVRRFHDRKEEVNE